MNCCIECFRDSYIRSLISKKGVIGNCDFCTSKNIAVYDVTITPNPLADIIIDLIQTYSVSESVEGKPLKIALRDDWDIFNAGSELILSLVKKLCESAFTGDAEIFSKNVIIPQLLDSDFLREFGVVRGHSWEEFSKSIKYVNRFHNEMFNADAFASFLSIFKKSYPTGSTFFRARISANKDGFKSNDMYAPPKGKRCAGRINPEGIGVSEPICAKDIVIRGHSPMIFVSEHDDVLCCTGVLLNERDAHLETLPYYFEGKHSTDKIVRSRTKGFFRISQGCIMLDRFIDEGVYNKEEKYKLCQSTIRFPIGASTSYGVYRNYSDEDIDMTRAIFGLQYDELSKLLDVYAKIFGIYNNYIQYPRITRYQQHDNFCELCGLWIPKQFPYITFAESGYDFSHVSLWGCYRYLQLIMRKDANSRIAKLFCEEGVNKTILEHLISLDEYELRKNSYYAQIVNEDMLRRHYNTQQ